MNILNRLVDAFNDRLQHIRVENTRQAAQTASDILYAAERGDMATLNNVFKNAGDLSTSKMAAYGLFAGAGEGQKEVVEFFLKRGVPPNVTIQGFGNKTAADSAIENGHTNIADLLKNHPAKNLAKPTGQKP